MSIQEKQRNIVFRNLANIVSILGVLPICILFAEHGYQYLIPLVLYNNIMDDLDGILASKLTIRSPFGALLDNICDAIVHTLFVMVVGMHFAQVAGHSYLGGVILASSLLATVAMIVRIVTRVDPSSINGTGSPTNELIRHMFFVLLLAQIFEFDPMLYLIATFALHAVSMLAPFKMPYLLRSLTKSATAIGMINVALLAAWLFPYAAPVVAALFMGTYLVSFAAGAYRWIQKEVADGP